MVDKEQPWMFSRRRAWVGQSQIVAFKFVVCDQAGVGWVRLFQILDGCKRTKVVEVHEVEACKDFNR